ncbi:hypothetical protein [Segniliparus rugosus]|uniref:Uncharacterized protein n=1 Tax=Segniliparus rugosus (strain ATCC BAA-974 / DSM 45345 / CCUG 50838 / CIP 108380 / JCM 13579 / CDC 945) TaxID=679197 RepID=E5XU10_SEGRC|nr:hypothetical protein [Segniliparus rugosus]EFV12179.1 hypothetical protein HMPREF9336_02982 [Segniliparus rugosus ATCC BAA-974]
MSIADKFYALQAEIDSAVEEREREHARQLEAKRRAERDAEEREQAWQDSREGRDEQAAKDLWESSTLRLGHYEDDEED